jgi:catechol 2,3-dioxygenase-like lactoylglutathione lyase family enzyme
MNSADPSRQDAAATPNTRGVDMKLEVAVLPVADVDRAKSFYQKLGWRLDADFLRSDGSRAVQLTPPGSPASIHLGEKPLFFLIVSDISAARAELVERGVEISEVFHNGKEGRISGPDPKLTSYGSLATFSDPDGNAWLLQQITARLPGRVDAQTASFGSSTELAAALRRAATAHGEHERRNSGQHDENWPDWYAAYLLAEQTGKPLPE